MKPLQVYELLHKRKTLQIHEMIPITQYQGDTHKTDIRICISKHNSFERHFICRENLRDTR